MYPSHGGNPASSANMSLLDQCLPRVSFYSNTARLRQDMQTLFDNCATLRPNVGVFQSSSGNITLFYLSGVIPITFNGANYNIPVTIYFDPPYPSQPPRVFVTPTASMIVKPNHRSVDVNGRVYLPQLTQWNGYSSNIVEIVTILASIFSAEPPVIAVQQRQQTPPSPSVIVVPPVPVSRRDQLLKSLAVKVRAKLPAKLKAEVDLANEAATTAAALKDKEMRLVKMNQEMTVLKSVMELKLAELNTADAETREWIAKQQAVTQTPQGGVIGYLEAESAVGQQLIDLLAEECAMEDLIDHLHTLNRNGKVSMSDLLREVRLLTRKLFETKTLKRRCLVVLQARSRQ